MRVMLKVEFPVEPANAAMKAGTMPKTIQAILDEQKPEAAYFLDSNGMRCGILVLDMQDASQIPEIAEPWFLAFNARAELHPVMTPADLAKAGPGIERAVKKYG
jgi:hypothetical protein